jgi:hypothetical protein
LYTGMTTATEGRFNSTQVYEKHKLLRT